MLGYRMPLGRFCTSEEASSGSAYGNRFPSLNSRRVSYAAVPQKLSGREMLRVGSIVRLSAPLPPDFQQCAVIGRFRSSPVLQSCASGRQAGETNSR